LINLVPITEFDFIIIYATDITANKLVNKFPDQNPNPVMRFNRKWQLQYFNDASNYIIENWKIASGGNVDRDVFVSVLKGETFVS